ncbi:hypothetical protein D3C85_1438990 [compost metagenome]
MSEIIGIPVTIFIWNYGHIITHSVAGPQNGRVSWIGKGEIGILHVRPGAVQYSFNIVSIGVN